MDQKYTVYSDMDGKMTLNGGTVLTALSATAINPDITVLISEKSSFRLKCKANHYAHFCTDITPHTTTTVTAYEVGARGILNSDTVKSLQYIYSFTTKKMMPKTFMKNCSTLAIMGSFYIFKARNEPNQSNPGYLLPPYWLDS